MPRARLVNPTTRPANPASAASVAFAYRRANQPFQVVWRSTGQVITVIGWPALCSLTGLSFATLRTRLSMFKAGYNVALQHPETMELDSATITRGPEPVAPKRPKPEKPPARPPGRPAKFGPPKPKRPRGRPPKQRFEQP